MPVVSTGDEPILESPECQTNASLAGGTLVIWSYISHRPLPL
ncbi:hypothetical protein PG5_59100 [Pseudomonas sp. G5(2012)]|nr:hypothetical protein PG5_59100 [Pseudomonas sp. G5(2012)]